MRFLDRQELYFRTGDCLQFLRQLEEGPGEAARPPHRFHMYWRGRFTSKTAFAVKSFLATQDPTSSELWLWLDTGRGYRGHDTEPLLRPLLPFLELRRFDPLLEARDTPLEGRVGLVMTRRPAARSDAFRLMVLYKHGGTYVDADTMFLRDMRVLLRRPGAAEFCMRWSDRPYGSSAFLRLRQGGETAHALMVRCVELGTCHPRPLLDFEANRNLDLLALPATCFDPLWLHRDRRDHYAGAPFDRFADFFRRFRRGFRRKPEIRSYRDFFPGAFTYHWHNWWDAPVHEDSYFGVFNRELDELLRDRLGIEPARPGSAAA